MRRHPCCTTCRAHGGGGAAPPLPSSPTPFSALLGGALRAGLSLARYSGGEDFSLAPCALHVSLIAAPAPPPQLQQRVRLRDRLITATTAVLRAEAADPDMQAYKGLPNPLDVAWGGADWSEELVVVGGAGEGGGHANLYFHGFLWPQGCSNEDSNAHPLIGLFEAAGCIGHYPPGALGALREDSLLPAGGGLRATDAHVHDGWSLGADMARVEVKGEGAGAGTAVCVDVRLPARPRVRLSRFIVLPRGADFAAAEAAVEGAGASEPGCDARAVVRRVMGAVQGLEGLLRAQEEWKELL